VEEVRQRRVEALGVGERVLHLALLGEPALAAAQVLPELAVERGLDGVVRRVGSWPLGVGRGIAGLLLLLTTNAERRTPNFRQQQIRRSQRHAPRPRIS